MSDNLTQLQHWREIRAALEPYWRQTHERWGETHRTPSRYMCRYTSEFVAMLEPTWTVVQGYVFGETHIWNERDDGYFLDLTGDQFNYPLVQHRPYRPPRAYIPGVWTISTPDLFQERAARWLADMKDRRLPCVTN